MKAQKYLEENYPKENRTADYFLGLADKNLERHLDLSDFTNLNNLWCSNNRITSLDISENKELEKIRLDNNQITANLNIFSHLTKLFSLVLSVEEGDKKTNDFVGSLKALENCRGLGILNIDYNEKITEGLEYLPNEIEYFSCRGTIFEETLEPFCRDYLAWKLVNYPNLAVENKDKLFELLDYKIGEAKSYLRATNVSSESKTIVEKKLQLLAEYKEKTIQAFSHKMVESIVEENKNLKERIKELEEKQLESKVEIPPKSGN